MQPSAGGVKLRRMDFVGEDFLLEGMRLRYAALISLRSFMGGLNFPRAEGRGRQLG